MVGLSTIIQGVHPQKETTVFGGPLIIVIHISGLHVDSNQLENEATPQNIYKYINIYE